MPEHSSLHHRSSIIDANDLCDGLRLFLTLFYTGIISEARSDLWSAHVDSRGQLKCFSILLNYRSCHFLWCVHFLKVSMWCWEWPAYSVWHLALKTTRMLKPATQKCHSEYHLWKFSKDEIVVPCHFLSSSLFSHQCQSCAKKQPYTDMNVVWTFASIADLDSFTHCFSELHWFYKYSTSFQV